MRDPYAETTPGEATARRPAEPLMTREKAAELGRAGAALAVLLLAIAVVVAAIS
ncbi:hypothetical protein [Falsiroseomonas ponticola]|uniref:hypothetical protein n=1 Tax=Falsiroseomonas ponticola TaxID=2786951 RepID=UPI00193288D3|nr:hypothetical protein [Roseomonas ponticola]